LNIYSVIPSQITNIEQPNDIFKFFSFVRAKQLEFSGKLVILTLLIILTGSFITASATDVSHYLTQTNRFLADTSAPDSANSVRISRSWELPAVLKNISAIDFISPNKMACLQNEVGSIFILSLDSGEIEKEYPFGPPGNYTGLVLLNKVAYVACADGRIIEINNYESAKPEVTEHGTHLTINENVNGLCYDRRNKRLLVTIKGTEDGNQLYKGIYSFRLADKRMLTNPAIKIDLRSRVFRQVQPKNMQTVFQPSDLDISPATGILYIVDGTRVQLLRMRTNENIKDLTELDKEKFIQPEGITFTPSGELFIASKGVREEPGMLFQIQLK
jgi:hypothetical protein